MLAVPSTPFYPNADRRARRWFTDARVAAAGRVGWHRTWIAIAAGLLDLGEHLRALGDGCPTASPVMWRHPYARPGRSSDASLRTTTSRWPRPLCPSSTANGARIARSLRHRAAARCVHRSWLGFALIPTGRNRRHWTARDQLVATFDAATVDLLMITFRDAAGRLVEMVRCQRLDRVFWPLVSSSGQTRNVRVADESGSDTTAR